MPATSPGKLGVLIAGLDGAVATTFVAGVELIKRGLARPVGSLTQLGRVDTAAGPRAMRDALPLAELPDLVFGGWDITAEDAYAAARRAAVLAPEHLGQCRDALEQLRPLPAVFDPAWVTQVSGAHVKSAGSKEDLARALIADIEDFQRTNRLSRMVVVGCGSTERYTEPGPHHADLDRFERAVRENAPDVTPSMLYAYAALRCGVPFVNATPNRGVDLPALVQLATERHVPVAGRDLKSGQTYLKTALAPAFRARLLGVSGWFSVNVLGNSDGLVLTDPGAHRAKEETKTGVLGGILRADEHPELYGSIAHKVAINYYPPRGDNKEAWDTIDVFGWLGYPMQVKVNFLCRDSILAAPLLLDLVLLIDLAARRGCTGALDWLSFYFKSPMTTDGAAPEHDAFVQLATLTERLERFVRTQEERRHAG
jgi:myo-inositol-1-phosphate synthase